ncbi:hypothetical protein ACGYWA_07025 [Burkholderia pseudomallei]
MKRMAYLCCILLSIGAVVCAHAGNHWLEPASVDFYGSKMRKIPSSAYLDLGVNQLALRALKNKKYVVDKDSGEWSSKLKCKSFENRYLVRSFFIGEDEGVTVYQAEHGLVVNSGALSEVRAPVPGAIAICLDSDPIDVRGSVSFAK